MATPFKSTYFYRYLAYFILLMFLCYCLSILPSHYQTLIPGTEFSGIACITGVILYICISFCFFYHKKIAVTKTDLYFFAAGIWMFISSLGISRDSIDPVTLYTYLFPFYFYFPLRILLSSREIPAFLYLLILCILSQALFCLWYQVPGHQSFLELKGTFFNPGLFGGYMAIGIVTISAILLREKPVCGKSRILKFSIYILLSTILILFFYLLYISFSRAAWLATGITLTVLLSKKQMNMWSKKINHLFRYRYLILSLSLLGLILATGFIYRLRPDSANGRLLIWQASSLLIRNKPFTGYGINGFSRNYMFSQGSYLEHHPDSPFTFLAADTTLPFNEYIKITVEQGFTGLLICVLLFVSAFQAGSRKRKVHIHLQALKYILLCILLFGFFSYPSGSFPYCLIVVVSLAFLSGFSTPVTTLRLPGNKRIVPFLVGICFIFAWQGKKTHCFLQSSSVFTKLYREAITTGNSTLLSPLYATLCSTPEYLLIYGQLLQESGEQEKALVVWEQLERCLPTAAQQVRKGITYDALGESIAAANCWERATRMVPSLIQPHYFLAKFYYDQNQYEKGLYHARKVIHQKPKSYLPDIYYMRQYIRERYPEASIKN